MALAQHPRRYAQCTYCMPRPFPLESLPLVNPSRDSATAGVIPPGNSANYNNQPITHGLQFHSGYQESSHAAIRLSSRYAHLSGTVYLDDAAKDFSGTISIYDMGAMDPARASDTDIAGGRVIFRYTFNGQGKYDFSTDVRNVNTIGIVVSARYNYELVTIDLGASLSTTGTRSSSISHTTPVPLQPLSGRITRGNTLVFARKPIPGASFYDLQFWLVSAATGQSIGPRSVTITSARVTGTIARLSTTLLPKGTYRWRVAAATRSSLSSWTPERTFILR